MIEPVAIFLLLVVLAFIAFVVARPFFEQRDVRAVKSSHEFSSLLAERERLLTELQELDFDQSLGKIPSEDYPAQRTELLQKGADVLRQLDDIAPSTARQANGKAPRADSTLKLSTLLSDDELEDLFAKRRYANKEMITDFCPKCGKPVRQSDDFCTSCGSILK